MLRSQANAARRSFHKGFAVDAFNQGLKVVQTHQISGQKSPLIVQSALLVCRQSLTLDQSFQISKVIGFSCVPVGTQDQQRAFDLGCCYGSDPFL